MKKLSLIAVVAATSMNLAAPTYVTAAPITYNLVGVTANFGTTFGMDNLTGTFTFDPATVSLNSADIVVTGPFAPGTYTQPDSDHIGTNVIGACPTSASSCPSSFFVFIQFIDNLGPSSDTVHEVGLSGISGAGPDIVTIDTFAVTGFAVPTPLPAALPLFATGIGGLGLLGWRRKRKNAAVIEAA